MSKNCTKLLQVAKQIAIKLTLNFFFHSGDSATQKNAKKWLWYIYKYITLLTGDTAYIYASSEDYTEKLDEITSQYLHL